MSTTGQELDLELWKTTHAWQLLAARDGSVAPSNAPILRAIATALRGGAAEAGTVDLPAAARADTTTATGTRRVVHDSPRAAGEDVAP